MSTLSPLRATIFFFVGILAVSCFLPNVHCQEIEQAELVQVLAHVDAETSGLVRINPTAIEALIKTGKEGESDPEQTLLQHHLKKTLEILNGDSIWLTVGFPQTPVSIQILVRDPDGKRIETLKALWDFPKRAPYGPEAPVVVRPLSAPNSKQQPDASRNDQWTKLLRQSTDTQDARPAIEFACLPPVHLYETYRELMTELPDVLGGGPVTLLTDGLQGVAGTANVKAGSLEAAVESATPDAAAAFVERAIQLLPSLATSNGESVEGARMASLLKQLSRASVEAVGNQVQCQIPAGENWQTAKVLEQMLGSPLNRSAMDRLRNLALAILNYESARAHLPPPPEARGPEKANRLSWRVHILPYLGKEEGKLYKKFELDEPWDSPTNIKLLPEMPTIFSEYGSTLLSPVGTKRGYTTVVAPSSDDTILGASRKVTFGAITDGSSNTILLVIVKDQLKVPWTAPQDYVFDPDKPSDGLKFAADKRTPVAMCDGSTMSLLKDNDWANLFEMNDGEVTRIRE